MGTVIISVRAEDAERLQEMARRENKSVEEVIHGFVEQNEAPLAKRFAGAEAYLAKLFAYARRYWHEHGLDQRAALTDEQLTEQFWCIDPEGIPRLNEDKDKVSLPPDHLADYLAMVWAENPEGETEPPLDYRKILNEEFPAYLLNRMQRNNE